MLWTDWKHSRESLADGGLHCQLAVGAVGAGVAGVMVLVAASLVAGMAVARTQREQKGKTGY